MSVVRVVMSHFQLPVVTWVSMWLAQPAVKSFSSKKSLLMRPKKLQRVNQAQPSKKISPEKNEENLCGWKLDALRRILCYSNTNPNNHDSFRGFFWLDRLWRSGFINFGFWSHEFSQFTFTLFGNAGLQGWLRGASDHFYVSHCVSLGNIRWAWRVNNFLVSFFEIYGCINNGRHWYSHLFIYNFNFCIFRFNGYNFETGLWVRTINSLLTTAWLRLSQLGWVLFFYSTSNAFPFPEVCNAHA